MTPINWKVESLSKSNQSKTQKVFITGTFLSHWVPLTPKDKDRS